MDSSANVFNAWQTYFMTLSAVCATLAGLLFVALSLHAASLSKPENANLRHLAQLTFGNFISILFIGMFYIVPYAGLVFYGMATVVTVGFGATYLFARLRKVMKDEANRPFRDYLLKRSVMGLVAYAVMLLGGVGMLLNPVNVTTVYYLVLAVFIGVTTMLMSAMRNSWYLLAHELG